MDESLHTAEVPRSIADLLPKFLENRQNELHELRGLLATGDFKRIAELAHRMIGVGTPYGFPYITDTARAIRDTALEGNGESLEALINGLGDYLGKVRIVVVPD